VQKKERMSMNTSHYLKAMIAALLIGAATSTALASNPTLGGPMSHLLVTLFNNEIFVTYESPSLATVDMQLSDGSFVGQSSVLNGLGYNAQFGWLANGFISLPPSSGIFVRTMSNSGYLDVYDQDSFDPIFGTDGSSDVWQWDGTMTHNWYATELRGPHHARYEVFVGDLLGNPLDGFTSGFVDLQFEFGQDLSGRVRPNGSGVVSTVPTPGPFALAMMCLPAGMKRRR
jgi:hypothetical protein